MVRRPAIYELNGEKSLADVLELAGGILPAAALKHVEVQRVEAHDKRTMLSLDLSSDNGTSPQLAAFKVQDGDEIHIFPIAPYNEDAIYLQGHVLRPGRYSYKKGMTLDDLITSYKDLLPEPAAHYAEIVRLNPPDFHPSVESFDLSAALANPKGAPKLEPLDTVRVFSRFDFEPAPKVWVGGEVRDPGQYVTSGQAHLRDAVFLAGGLTSDASLSDAQLFRRETDGNLKILSVNLRAALDGNPIDNILLEPRDRLLIHRSLDRVDPQTVDIRGEVANPGKYPLTGNMRAADLIRVAGGLKRSADTQTADLTHYPLGAQPGEHLSVSLSAVLNGNETEDIPLRNGDTLTIKQVPGWTDLGASVTLRGEVNHPGNYGIQPGERLSSVIERAGGYTPEAFPYGAVLMRSSVREIEQRQRAELIRRVEAQRTSISTMPENDADQKSAKLNALAQTQAALNQLHLSPPVGRLVIHIQDPVNKWRNSQSDVALRDGDVLLIPKRTAYVMVTGQVFNPTAVSYRGGRSAKWYLGQAGGLSPLADKKGVFVIRADGSVISSRNDSGWFAGNPLDAELRPGDTVVVPEKALNVGNKNWTALLQTAQIASSVALTVAYFHP
jgi:protein involved in polysaccharide export with SLBB domain